MEPLIALAATTLIVYLAARLLKPSAVPWPVALRTGVAVMFVMTGTVHFVAKRDELIDMVPPALPAPAVLVTLTGILELAGAAALLFVPRLRVWAAGGLTLLLLAMFPANVYKATTADVSWDDSLIPRTIMQVVFIAAVVAVFSDERRAAVTA
ncbi:DoxX family protein [Gordonia crocea]|uniref:DoxX family protein n=1 Tax=Gordonia crocea TaxID=589162 RepID=A0A7I9V058_9ACTN|nr:DoxX family protein [Gordonia crocea]GED98824.1 hypothetical protein nbrc107697_28630 [Gordonia crocea]